MKSELDWGTYEDWKAFMPSEPHSGDQCAYSNLYYATLGGAGSGECGTQKVAYRYAVEEYCKRHNLELPWRG